MNIANIEKVANRQRINAEAEKLREKVHKETRNIIKLRVAQDTAYWDLKEKLHQLENNHERLQQNMVEVQMQHETISGQYQDELRLRPETLNKLSSTREICDVLEEYSERLKATVSRCKADQAMLAEAYNKSGQLVRNIKDRQIQSENKYQEIVKNLHEKVKLLTDHKEEMVELFASSKQHLEAELSDARSKLATALVKKDELFVALNELSRKLDHCKRELEKKDENIANLQMDTKKLIHEFNNQITEMRNLNMKQETELKDCTVANESLKKALQNQEQFTQSICDQNNQLLEKVANLEEEQIISSKKANELETKLEESQSHCGKQVKDLEVLNVKIEELGHEIHEKKMLLEQSTIEQQILKEQISTLEDQKSEINAELDKISEESALRTVEIGELSSVIEDLQAKILEMENLLESNKNENAIKVEELSVILETKLKLIDVKDKELECKASTINQLMSDLKNEMDARTKVQNNIDKMKKETQEKEKATIKKIEQLENAAKERESELSKQMSIILDMRNEKDRLQERLKGMQNTINNIEKEVSGRSATLPTRTAAELDDNAVMMNPKPMVNKKVGIPPPRKIQKTSELAAPKDQTKRLDNMLYNFFSDSSMDNELVIDPEDVNRHFDAITRGERVSPLTFKRKSGASFSTQVPKPLSDAPLCLSQMRQAKAKRTIFKTKRQDNKAKKGNKNEE